MKIVVCDPISPKGIALLQQRGRIQVVVLPKRLPEAELIPLVADAVALVVRSETKVTAKIIAAAPKLRVVGRAGVGVDNVDIEAATQHGTVVMNTPGGNTITTAELTFTMILSLARKVPQAPRRWSRENGIANCFKAWNSPEKRLVFWAWAGLERKSPSAPLRSECASSLTILI
jgi:D-3-phosphoglycerate dehydrogenase